MPGLSLRVGDMLDGLFRVESLVDAERSVLHIAGSQVADGTPVMIQILVANGPAADQARFRFMAGVRKANALSGPHVARVLDIGITSEGHPYVVREKVAERSLATLLDECSSLSTEEAVDLALDVCDAVAEAHRHGLIHGDLGPRSVHLGWSAGPVDVKVIDLGIGPAMSELGLTPGNIARPTLHLRAPEQLQRGRRVDARADVWAVGAILYTMLAGAPPFAAETPSSISVAVENDEPDALAGVPDALAELVEACLAKDPARRPATIGVLAEALATFSPRAGASLTRIRAHAAPMPKTVETPAAAMPALLLERESERRLPDSSPTIVARQGYESFAHRASVPDGEASAPRAAEVAAAASAPRAPEVTASASAPRVPSPDSSLQIPVVVEPSVRELPRPAKTLEMAKKKEEPKKNDRTPEPVAVVARSVPPMVIERDAPTVIVPRRRPSWKVAGAAIAAASLAVGVVIGMSSARLANHPSQGVAAAARPPAAAPMKNAAPPPAEVAPATAPAAQEPALASTPATDLPPAPLPPAAPAESKSSKAKAHASAAASSAPSAAAAPDAPAAPAAKPVDSLVQSASAPIQPSPKANDDDLRRFLDDRR